MARRLEAEMEQRRRSRSEWREVIAAWRASGLSQQEFAERHGIARRTLSWWVWKLKAEAAEELDEALFVPVTIPPNGSAEPWTDRPIGVVEHEGVRIALDASADPRWVAALVRELGEC